MNKFLKWVIYITMSIIPFLAFYVTSVNPVSMQMLFPYITGKNFAFRILVEMAAAAWLMLLVMNKEFRPKKSLLLYAYSAFIFVLLLADIFSVNPTRSFFSNFERMEGFIAHAHLFLYFLILVSVFKTREMWENAKFVLFISNVPVLLLAYLQLLGLKEFSLMNLFPALRDSVAKYFAPSQGGWRLDSSLGNSEYLAIYAVFFTFLFFMSFIENRLKNKDSYLYLVMSLLNLFILYWTGTRGAQIGFMVGLVVSLVIILVASKKYTELKSVRKYSAYSLVAVAILFVGLVLASSLPSVQNSPSLSRFTKVVHYMNPFFIIPKIGAINTELYNPNSTYTSLLATVGDGTLASRAMNVKMGLEGFKEKPVLGWGQDNYFYVFAKYNDPRMYTQEPWFDRSHNVFFDWLIAAGALGLIAYLSLYFVAIYTLWFAKATRKHHDSYADFVEKSLITGMIVAYFIHNIFVFDNIVSYILFFALLAYVGVRFDHSDDKKEASENKSSIIKNVNDKVIIYGPFIIVLLCASLYYLNWQYVKANFAIITGLSPAQQASDKSPLDALNRSLEGFKQSAEIGGVAMMESREQLAQQTLSLISQIKNANLPQNEETLPIYALAYNFIETTKSEYQSLIDSQKVVDPRSLSIYATFLRSIGDNENALKFDKQAHDYAPMKQTITIDYIQTLLAAKNFAEAESVAKAMYESDKSFDQAKAVYALTLAYDKKYEEALVLSPDLKDQIDSIQKQFESAN